MKNEMKELKLEEMAMAAGGDIIDDIACHFGKHNLKFVVGFTPDYENGHQIDYDKYVCKNCGKVFYYKYEFDKEKKTRINHEEFEAHSW